MNNLDNEEDNFLKRTLLDTLSMTQTQTGPQHSPLLPIHEGFDAVSLPSCDNKENKDFLAENVLSKNSSLLRGKVDSCLFIG